MHFDLAAIPQSDACKLLVSTMGSPPIALATMVDREGRVERISLAEWKAGER